MKKVIALLSLALVVLVSCEGPQGPPGFDGQNGLNGEDGLIGQVFDQVISFGVDDDFKTRVDFPNNFNVIPDDVVLVYRLAEIDNGVDIWQLMPQNFFLDEGILQYNFDFTSSDVDIFLDGNFDLTLLGNEFTQEQIFRIAVIPAGMVQGKDLDALQFSEIENMLDTTSSQLLF